MIVWSLIAGRVSNDGSAGFQLQLYTPWQYFYSQGEVIAFYYLKLAFWPTPLILDYQCDHVPAYFREDMLGVMGLAVTGVLLAVSLFGAWKKKWWGFCGVWFFLILGPTSSFMPIADVIFEHRMYLSLAGVIVLVVFGVDWLVKKFVNGEKAGMVVKGIGLSGVLLAFMLLTIARNGEYANGITIWQTVVARAPGNARAWHNLGMNYDRFEGEDRSQDAIYCFNKAIEAVPNHYEAANSLGKKMLDYGELDEAVKFFNQAIKYQPKIARFHYNLGRAYWMKKDYQKAIDSINAALRLDEGYAKANNNLGLVYLDMGKVELAEEQFKIAIGKDGEMVDAYYNLSQLYLRGKRFDEAGVQLKKAIEIDPQRFDVLNGLGQVAAMKGDLQGALKYFEQSLEKKPKYATAYRNVLVLAVQYAKAGQVDQAILLLRKMVDYGQRYQLPGDLVGAANAQLDAFEKQLKRH